MPQSKLRNSEPLAPLEPISLRAPSIEPQSPNLLTALRLRMLGSMPHGNHEELK